MRNLGVGLVVTGLAFLLGVSGVPGAFVSLTAVWLQDRGAVELRGPVGDAVKVAFPELAGPASR